MKNKKAIKKIIGASFITGFLFATALTIFLSGNVNEDISLTPEVKTSEWKKVQLPFLGGDPAAGASGVHMAYVAVHATTYTGDNLTAGEYYASGDTNDTSIGSNVPYDTAHDLVIKVRWNTTHAYNATAGAWDLNLVRCYTNCSDLSVSAEIAEEAEIGHDASYIWVHYYLDNSDAGFTIDRGEEVESVEWTFEYYG
jgi:hypothetical protein